MLSVQHAPRNNKKDIPKPTICRVLCGDTSSSRTEEMNLANRLTIAWTLTLSCSSSLVDTLPLVMGAETVCFMMMVFDVMAEKRTAAVSRFVKNHHRQLLRAKINLGKAAAYIYFVSP